MIIKVMLKMLITMMMTLAIRTPIMRTRMMNMICRFGYLGCATKN